MAGHAVQATIETGRGARVQARGDDHRPLAGALLFAVGAQFMTVIMLGASMAPGYDLSDGAISDLGVIDETAGLFNASLIATGVLTLAAGYLLYRHDRRPWVLATFALAAIGAVGAGMVPLDRSEVHGLSALVAFLFFNLLPLATLGQVRGPMRIVSIAAGLTGLAFVMLMVVGDAGNPGVFGPIGHGGAERMIVYPAMLWLMAFGGYLMAARRSQLMG